MRPYGGKHRTEVGMRPPAPSRPPGSHPFAIQLEELNGPSLDGSASSRMSSSLERLCGSTSRSLISQNGPSGSSAVCERGYEVGSVANSVSLSASASISTQESRRFTALRRSPRATCGEIQTLTSAEEANSSEPTNSLHIPSTLTSSGSHCRTSFAMTPCRPLPSKLRNGPHGLGEGGGPAKARSISQELPERWIRLHSGRFRHCSFGGTGSWPLSRRLGRSSGVRRCRRATPDSDLATSWLACQLPS